LFLSPLANESLLNSWEPLGELDLLEYERAMKIYVLLVLKLNEKIVVSVMKLTL